MVKNLRFIILCHFQANFFKEKHHEKHEKPEDHAHHDNKPRFTNPHKKEGDKPKGHVEKAHPAPEAKVEVPETEKESAHAKEHIEMHGAVNFH